MNFDISYETALLILSVAYVTSLMLLVAASNVGILILETLEENN